MFHDDFEQELYVDKFKQIIDLWWFSDFEQSILNILALIYSNVNLYNIHSTLFILSLLKKTWII